jgi:hypothetical protein
MQHLEEDLATVARGDEPRPEPLTAEHAACRWLWGRRRDGAISDPMPRAAGKIRWREVSGCWPAWASIARGPDSGDAACSPVVWWRSWGISRCLPRLWLEALRQGIAVPQVVWLSDGARGLWRLYEEQFSASATGILDFYHAAQNLWKSAAA